MRKTRYFPGSVDEECDLSLQGERNFPLLSSNSNCGQSAESKEEEAVSDLLSKGSASVVSPPKPNPYSLHPWPAALKSVPLPQGRLVVLEELAREVEASLVFPRTSSV